MFTPRSRDLKRLYIYLFFFFFFLSGKNYLRDDLSVRGERATAAACSPRHAATNSNRRSRARGDAEQRFCGIPLTRVDAEVMPSGARRRFPCNAV